jgi:hypothetical protein
MHGHASLAPIVTRAATLTALALCAAVLPSQAFAQGAAAQPSSDWTAVDQALGRKGALQPGDVMKYSFPRSDLEVTAAGVALKPALALGSWIAFKSVAGGHTMVMGDLVLGEEEVGPVMRALQQGGVEQTALHNHVLHESPRVMYMHIAAHGDAAKIAQTVHTALGASRTPLGAPSTPAPSASIDLDTAAIARTLGIAGKVNGGVYQVSVPRRDTIREGANEIPPSMGVATAINFQPTGGGKAAITGDFVMRASEVNNVIRALQQGGIDVTALHSHMLTEEPRLFFMHFWANDDAVKLAGSLHDALSRTSAQIARR